MAKTLISGPGFVPTPLLEPRAQDALLSVMELPLTEVFHPLGFPVLIQTNDATVLRAAEKSFGHNQYFREAAVLKVPIAVSCHDGAACPPLPARHQANHLFLLVADAENHAVLDFRSCTSFTWVTRAAVQHRTYFRHNFLEKVVYLLLGASMVTDLHAASVSNHGKGVLLFGDSGAGKTTLAYACARVGWTYTSDDTSYLINDSNPPRVVGHSHRVRFRPSARTVFPELEGHAIAQQLDGKPSIEVLVSGLPIPHTAAEASVDFIIYLRRRDFGGAELVPLPAGAATQRVIADLHSAGEIRARHEGILRALDSLPAFELRYRALESAIELLDRLTGRE